MTAANFELPHQPSGDALIPLQDAINLGFVEDGTRVELHYVAKALETPKFLGIIPRKTLDFSNESIEPVTGEISILPTDHADILNGKAITEITGRGIRIIPDAQPERSVFPIRRITIGTIGAVLVAKVRAA